MRSLLILCASALALAGCAGPEEMGPAESTGTGDEGIGSSGVEGTGGGGESTQCPPLATEAQLVTEEEAEETACPTPEG